MGTRKKWVEDTPQGPNLHVHLGMIAKLIQITPTTLYIKARDSDAIHRDNQLILPAVFLTCPIGCRKQKGLLLPERLVSPSPLLFTSIFSVDRRLTFNTAICAGNTPLATVLFGTPLNFCDGGLHDIVGIEPLQFPSRHGGPLGGLFLGHY
jgi:hypothetical protein